MQTEKIFMFFDMPKRRGLAFLLIALTYIAITVFLKDSLIIYFICGHICSEIGMSIYKSRLTKFVYKTLKEDKKYENISDDISEEDLQKYIQNDYRKLFIPGLLMTLCVFTGLSLAATVVKIFIM